MPRLGHRLLWCTALLVGVALTPLTVHASSVTIFNTFGPGHSFDNGGGIEVGTANGVITITAAMAFTPNMTAPLFAIDVAIGSESVTGTQFNLALVTDNGGQPGSVLESWSLTATFLSVTCAHCFETAFSTQNPILQAGTQYWLVASPGPNPTPISFVDDAWLSNSIGVLGTSASSVDGGKTWGIHTNGGLAAFDVRGITAVPEPSTLALLGTGLLGIAGATRRKFKNGAFRNLVLYPRRTRGTVRGAHRA
jgi:hypothetical protein